MKQFVLICGLPNAGKTTFSKQFENVVHLDDVIYTAPKERIPNTAKEINSLSDKNDIVVEGVFFLASTRKKLLSLLDFECKKTCVWLCTSKQICIARENRGREVSMIQQLHEQFQPPTLDEGWDEIIVIN